MLNAVNITNSTRDQISYQRSERGPFFKERCVSKNRGEPLCLIKRKHYKMVSGVLVSVYVCVLTVDVCQAGAPVKDVTLPDDPSKKALLLTKHADYIEAFEKDKDDYVSRHMHVM